MAIVFSGSPSSSSTTVFKNTSLLVLRSTVSVPPLPSSLLACYRRAVSKGPKVCGSVQSVRFSRLWYTRPPHRIYQIKLQGFFFFFKRIDADFVSTVTPYLKPELLYFGDLKVPRRLPSQQFQHGWKVTDVMQSVLLLDLTNQPFICKALFF